MFGKYIRKLLIFDAKKLLKSTHLKNLQKFVENAYSNKTEHD